MGAAFLCLLLLGINDLLEFKHAIRMEGGPSSPLVGKNGRFYSRETQAEEGFGWAGFGLVMLLFSMIAFTGELSSTDATGRGVAAGFAVVFGIVAMYSTFRSSRCATRPNEWALLLEFTLGVFTVAGSAYDFLSE